MQKTNKHYFLLAVMGCVISLMGNAIARAEDMPLQNSITSHAPVHDILSENDLENSSSLGDTSDNDAANDYDSTQESESENAAPIPSEEEDNPVLDEEGNVSIPSKTIPPQS
jgi:hypothetical protein